MLIVDNKHITVDLCQNLLPIVDNAVINITNENKRKESFMKKTIFVTTAMAILWNVNEHNVFQYVDHTPKGIKCVLAYKQWKCVVEPVQNCESRTHFCFPGQRSNFRWLITFWADKKFHQLNSTVHLFCQHQEAHQMNHLVSLKSDIIAKGLPQLLKQSYYARNYKVKIFIEGEMPILHFHKWDTGWTIWVSFCTCLSKIILLTVNVTWPHICSGFLCV